MSGRWWVLAVAAVAGLPMQRMAAQSEVVIEAPELREGRGRERDRDMDRDDDRRRGREGRRDRDDRWNEDDRRDRERDDWRDGRRRARDDDWDDFNDDGRWRRRWDREVVYVGGAWDDLPPGLRKQAWRGRRLPPGWAYRVRQVPVVVARRLPPVWRGHERVWIDGRVITRDRRSGTIVDIGVIWRR